MKKVILVMAALVLSAGAFAQKNQKEWMNYRNWSYGVKAGVNFAEVSDFGYNSKMKTGFYAGIFAEYQVNYWLGFQSELLYSAQGNRYDIGDASLKSTLGYLTMPMLAKFYVLDRLSVDFGPQIGFLVNKEVDLRDPLLPGSNQNRTNVFDFSIGMGLTYNIAKIDITARYNLGLTDVFKNLSGTNRNGVIQAGLGYRF